MTKEPDQELLPENFNFWNDNLPFPMSLSEELQRWKRLWITDHDESTTVIPSNFLEALSSCVSVSFPNIYHLLLIGCTLPITSAEAERTFSLLRRIKTYTGLTLSEEHLSDLAVMAMHYKERIPAIEVIKTFIQQQPRRIFLNSILDDD